MGKDYQLLSIFGDFSGIFGKMADGEFQARKGLWLKQLIPTAAGH